MENKAFITSEILKRIHSLTTELFFSLHIKEKMPFHDSIHTNWSPPHLGFLKLNTDGFVRVTRLEPALATLLEILWAHGLEVSLEA